MKEQTKRLNLEINEKLHWDLKQWASIRNMSMTFYVESILADQIIRENQFYEESGKSE